MMSVRRRLARRVHELLGGSYAHAKHEVETGHVTVNGAVVIDPGAWTGDGDALEHRPELPRRDRAPRAPGIPILLRDEDIVVVVKPAGLLVHPTDERDEDTVLSRTAAALGRVEPHVGRLFIVHRLDQGTSGVLVVARSHQAAENLQDQFRIHSVDRRYVAIVCGNVKGPATVEREVGRPRPGARRGALAAGSGGKMAKTLIVPLEHGAGATLVEAQLGTGRTHQVRVHLSYLGHPVLGDAVYGAPKDDPAPAKRIALHARLLAFDHPRTGERLSFEAALPKDLAALWRRLSAGGPGTIHRGDADGAPPVIPSRAETGTDRSSRSGRGSLSRREPSAGAEAGARPGGRGRPGTGAASAPPRRHTPRRRAGH